MELMFVGLCTLLMLGMYFLPWLVCGDKKQSSAVLLVNLFLGWTFIGWLVSFFWALFPQEEKQQTV